MENIKKVQSGEKMSEVSKVVSDRDRARLQFKEYVMELAAARGQEDDVIDKLIVKVNEAFDVLLNSHVELVLSLGEDLSNDIHENFMYEASDERDEAVEEAEEEKVKAKEIIKEKTIAKKSIKVNNLGLMGKKDREEYFDEKLEISRKVSHEVAESELFCMFSAWVNLQDARPDASLQGGEVPHEASRALNRAISIKQKLPSIPEEVFDGDAERKAAANEREEYKVAVEPKAASHVVKLEGNEAGKLKRSAVKDHKLRYIAQNESIRIMGEGAVMHTPSSIELYDPVGGAPVGEEYVFSKSARASQFVYDNGKLAKYGVWGTKHLTQQESVSFKLEQQFGDLQQARDLAKLKLLGTINAERSAGSIVLVTKCGFDKKGVGDSNLLEQYNYIVRSYEDTGPLIKYNRFKVSGAVCLEEKHRAFNREEFNILLKHTIDKLKFSGTAYAKIFIGGFGLFAKPVHTSKVGRLKDIDPRFQRRLKDIYLRIQKEEGDRA